MKKMIIILLVINLAVELKSLERVFEIKPLKEFDLGLLNILMDYSCYDADNCIIVRTDDNGAGLIAEKTSNGGKTWQFIYADTSFKSSDSIYMPRHSAQRVKYFSDGTVIIISDKGQILKSVDYGSTFKEYLIEHFFYIGFEMLDSKTAIASSGAFMGVPGSKNFLKISKDGCQTWDDFQLPDSLDLKYFNQIYTGHDSTIVFQITTNEPRSIIVNTDYHGSNWISFERPGYFEKVHFLSDKEAIGLGSFKVTGNRNDTAIVSKTYDGGLTWEIKFKAVYPYERFFSAATIHDSLLIVSGEWFGFVYSTDNGESWNIPQYDFIDGAHPQSNFIVNINKLDDKSFYFQGKMASQLLKATMKTTSVQNSHFKPEKLFPNPLINQTLNMDFTLFKPGLLKIYVTDLGGRVLYNLYEGYEESGNHSRTFQLPDYLISGSYWIVSEINGINNVQLLNIIK